MVVSEDYNNILYRVGNTMEYLLNSLLWWALTSSQKSSTVQPDTTFSTILGTIRHVWRMIDFSVRRFFRKKLPQLIRKWLQSI